jgi:hypothetical protein
MDTKITLTQDALAGKFSVKYVIHERPDGGAYLGSSSYHADSMVALLQKTIEAHVAAVRALHRIKKRNQV